MEIVVEQPTEDFIENRKIRSWPIWEKEVSKFDWHYDSTEECLVLEGHVIVETPDGQRVEFGPGDFVTFPQGLSCTWEIKAPIRKHYNFL